MERCECAKRTVLLWVILQREVVISYGRFGTTDPTCKGQEITTDRYMITQKSTVLIYFTAEDRNLAE